MIDFDKYRLINLAEFIKSNGFSDLKKESGNNYLGLCPLHGENSPSFRVYSDNKFKCYGCGKHGDLIQFLRYYYNCEVKEAIEKIDGKKIEEVPREQVKKSDFYSDFEIIPGGDRELMNGWYTVPILNPKTGELKTYQPSRVFKYFDRIGRFYCYTIRIDLASGKKITPSIFWCVNRKLGFEGWSMHRGWEMPPLYMENMIKGFQKIILVDGEKTADELNMVFGFSKLIAVCCKNGWPFGKKQNFESFKGKDVLVIPDNTDDEFKDSKRIINNVKTYNPKSISTIERDVNRPKGWDLADAIIDDGWRCKEVLSWISSRLVKT